MKSALRPGSALILALLMTTVITSCALYAWHMASFAYQLARTQYSARCYEQSVQGLLAYAVAFAKTYYPKLCSATHEHTKDTQFTFARFPCTRDHVVQGHVLLQGYKDYVYIVATLMDKERVCSRASCSLRQEEKQPGREVVYILDGFTLQGS